MKKTTVMFAMIALLASWVSLSANDAEEGFVSLFDGKTLAGWVGDERLWSVEEGAIVGRTDDEGRKITYNHFLVYDTEEFGDFVLRFDYKLSNPGNSGMQYRRWRLEGDRPWGMGGYQADFDGEATYTGIVYGENFRGILAHRGTDSFIGNDGKPVEKRRFTENETLKNEIKIEDWNSYEVVAKGFSFRQKINGHRMSRLVDEDTDARRAQGLIGIQLHVGPPMKVEVKNIRIKKLSE